MMYSANLQNPIIFTPSERGTLHCLQASMVMAVQSLLGRSITLTDAEMLSGYRAGHATWPYQMFLSFADMGLAVTSIEAFDPHGMADDPSAEVRRIYTDPEVVAAVIADMDVDAESERARRCLRDPRIRFEVRAPHAREVVTAIAAGDLALISLNYAILEGTPGFEGHMVVAASADDDSVTVIDPGPPGDPARATLLLSLDAAMHSPTSKSGALIRLRRT